MFVTYSALTKDMYWLFIISVVKCKTYVWRFHREGSYEDDGVGVAFINNGYYTREVSDE